MQTPIAIFIFNRPNHTFNTISNLKKNAEFKDSEIYFFCDGPRTPEESLKTDETRRVAHDLQHPKKHIIESQHNKGLSASIKDGVNHVLQKHESIIVIEDDLIVSPHFLNYMNTALKKYSSDERVAQIAGHMFPIKNANSRGSVFLPFPTSWGWGTWKRAWQGMTEESPHAIEKIRSRRWRFSFDLNGAYPFSKMLSDRIKNKNNSWAIWFYYNFYNKSNVALYPNISLVNNSGFDGTGTHCRPEDMTFTKFEESPVNSFPAEVNVDNNTLLKARRFLMKQRGLTRISLDTLWRLFGGRHK